LLITISQLYAFGDTPFKSVMMVVLLAVLAGIYVYLFLAMKQFYAQSWFKTALKFLIQSSITTIVLLIITVVVFFNLMVSLAEA
jgi:hypothetical protein